MQPIRHVAVIDIGKTNAKVALVDMESLSETAVRKTPNKVRHDGPYPHHDTEALWSFIQASLSELNVAQPIDAISVTTHGATAALVDGNGGLALPILDYELSLPDATSAAYRAARPDFTETGAPLLPVGLNLAAQIFWQQAAYPEAFARRRRHPDVPAILGLSADRRGGVRSDFAGLPHRSLEPCCTHIFFTRRASGLA